MRIQCRCDTRSVTAVLLIIFILLGCISFRFDPYLNLLKDSGPVIIHFNRIPTHTANSQSYFLEEFKNPCYLSSNEQRVLGPFRNNSKDFNSQKHGAYVDINGNKPEVLRCLPYYYVLGWAKCGTTNLATKVYTHPHILKAPVKEPAFFSSLRFGKSSRSAYAPRYADEYADFLDNNTREMARYYSKHGGRQQVPLIVGDHSTHTVDQMGISAYNKSQHYTAEAPRSKTDAIHTFSNPQFIKYLTPNSKLIIMIRDPVDRSYSLYKMHEAVSPEEFHNGVVSGIKVWNDCIKSDASIYDCLYTTKVKRQGWEARAIASIPKSLYYYFVKEWMTVFSKQQLLFIKFTDFTHSPDNFINSEVFPFLGVPKLTGSEYLAMTRSNREHVKRVRPKGDGSLVDHSYNKPMLPKTREILTEFFKPYNAKLAELLNDDDYKWGYD